MQKEFIYTVKSNLIKRGIEKKNNEDSSLKTCLVVQGGGMRASYSMGCLQALEELGFSNSFDYIIGSSAGAINGAYFLTKQSKVATKVYSDYITNNRFINFFRLRKILDVNYLVEILSKGETALNIEEIKNSSTDLMFAMVHYPSAEKRIFSIKDKPSEIMNLIKASATIPALSNEKIIIDGEKYIDGAVVDSIPLMRAIELGCTDIVVVLTRSRSFRRRPLRFVYNFLSFTYFRDWPKKSKDSLFDRFSEINNLYDFIYTHEGSNGNYRILVVAPKEDSLAGVLSKNRGKILQNIHSGYEDVMAIFR
ncbi:MAG: patatin family protein [Candidatus Paceibacterota bacterium]|jgi:predicted patatin/cPLA2 family phospholipase